MPSNAQKRALSHLSGPAIITAGPGSGKTFTIINRILYLISHHHIPPNHILVITYTKAAAAEMKERYEAQGAACGVHFGTFHSICFNILKNSGRVSANSLIKESDKRKLLQIILANHGLSHKSNYDSISSLENLISQMKNMMVMSVNSNTECSGKFEAVNTELQYVESNGFTGNELKMLREDYDRHIREQGMIDFEDMISECLSFLWENPKQLAGYRQLFEYLLVDEFQDINSPQYELLKLLAAPSNNLFVVGDDDQAIYGFRGAAPEIMRNFLKDFPNAEQIMLTENYRCGAEIVKLSGNVISRNKERFSKEFLSVKKGGQVLFYCFDTRKEEEVQLVKELSSLYNEQLSSTAVIVRTNIEVVQYAGLLKENAIPVKGQYIKEDDIYHNFIMEDICAFLSYLYEGNKRGDFIRFMNKPNRFLTRAALLGEMVNQMQLEAYYSRNPVMVREIAAIFNQLRIASHLSPYLAVIFFRKTYGYDKYLREKAKDYRDFQRLMVLADKVENCFKELRAGYPVRDFVKVQADKTGNTEPQTGSCDGVSILTMHGSKGLEFEHVFLPDVNEGIIPGKNVLTESALEEERRLLYVAMTRAKEKLYLYCTKERGRKPSRYLEGLVSIEKK